MTRFFNTLISVSFEISLILRTILKKNLRTLTDSKWKHVFGKTILPRWVFWLMALPVTGTWIIHLLLKATTNVVGNNTCVTRQTRRIVKKVNVRQEEGLFFLHLKPKIIVFEFRVRSKRYGHNAFPIPPFSHKPMDGWTDCCSIYNHRLKVIYTLLICSFPNKTANDQTNCTPHPYERYFDLYGFCFTIIIVFISVIHKK